MLSLIKEKINLLKKIDLQNIYELNNIKYKIQIYKIRKTLSLYGKTYE
jgi:hypothetical protein